MNEVPIRPALGTAFRKYTASPCGNHPRPKRRPRNSHGPIFRVDCWCAPLLIPLCFSALLALSGCGDLVVNRASAGLLSEPSTVNFGTVAIGQTASTTVSILNESLAPIQVTQLNLTGQPFSVVGASNLPITIASGGNYTLNLQFNPAAAGTVTGQLTIGSNSSTPGTPLISLSGTGMTGTGPAALSALSCNSGAMTGSGTDACSVTLTTSAPSGGLILSLSSSNAAVSLPSTVTVPAGAVGAGFSATVSSVATAQAVTMTANAGSISRSFTLQLNAAILALSINATSVAFGDVMVNTSATQPVTLASTGTLPVTVNGTTLTGAGFTMSGAAFPATLSPGQQAMLNIEFDPTSLGMATGQLVVSSNASTSSPALVSLSGTGTTAQVVAVAVTPATVSIASGANQQFTASVTGTTNTAVTWMVSGTGCSGATCGTISSSGLYTAPTAGTSPATVNITATSVSDPTKSASATVTITTHTGSTYYLAPESGGGNDSNNGLSASSPWLSPNHALNCGDIIIAAASTTYNPRSFNQAEWGTVTCPSNDNVAWLLCATFDGCKITSSSGYGMWVSKSYWGVTGWEVALIGGPSNQYCFEAAPASGAGPSISHIIFANDIANGCYGGGIGTASQGAYGVDYLAIVANIIYNGARGSSDCFSGIDLVAPTSSDSLPGTHIYVAGNFIWDNVDPDPCAGGTPSDGEGIVLDSWDYNSYTQQSVVENNLTFLNGSSGIKIVNSTKGKFYVEHNTTYGNNSDSHARASWCGELTSQGSENVVITANLSRTNAATGCGGFPSYLFFVAAPFADDVIDANFGYSAAGNNTAQSGSGFVFGPNNSFGTDPMFTDAPPSDPGAPSCTSTTSVPTCMATIIADFVPTNKAALGYGYQAPSSIQVDDQLFPHWLCSANLPLG